MKYSKKIKVVILSMCLIYLTSIPALAMDDDEIINEKPVNYYRVQTGDTLESVAQYYNIDPALIALMNGLQEGANIQVEQVLAFPNEQTIIHHVREGETLSGIAKDYSVTVEHIIKENELMDANSLKIDQELAISAPLSRAVISPSVSRGQSIIPFLWPLDGVVTSPFGERKGNKHEGIDIAGNLGMPIIAARKGKVIFAGPRGTYGNAVIIAHEYGFTTLYGHTSKILVNVGDDIQTGEKIALVGSTGRSTGPHLHFEIRRNTVPLDPINILPQKR